MTLTAPQQYIAIKIINTSKQEPEQSGFIHLRRYSMTEIFAILLVIEVIMIIRGTIQGRMLPWVLALIATLILIAGTVGRIV